MYSFTAVIFGPKMSLERPYYHILTILSHINQTGLISTHPDLNTFLLRMGIENSQIAKVGSTVLIFPSSN